MGGRVLYIFELLFRNSLYNIFTKEFSIRSLGKMCEAKIVPLHSILTKRFDQPIHFQSLILSAKASVRRRQPSVTVIVRSSSLPMHLGFGDRREVADSCFKDYAPFQ
ncbi:hypothetical protein Q3G72_017061 [Acer saccharum]|nr:hypothetical protein Q3G72_017061 [Acer saccharum]